MIEYVYKSIINTIWVSRNNHATRHLRLKHMVVARNILVAQSKNVQVFNTKAACHWSSVILTFLSLLSIKSQQLKFLPNLQRLPYINLSNHECALHVMNLNSTSIYFTWDLVFPNIITKLVGKSIGIRSLTPKMKKHLDHSGKCAFFFPPSLPRHSSTRK